MKYRASSKIMARWKQAKRASSEGKTKATKVDIEPAKKDDKSDDEDVNLSDASEVEDPCPVSTNSLITRG